MIYLDYAATTPISEKAMEVYSSVAQRYFGNASSLHEAGSSALQIKEASARAIAQSLGADAKAIHFTSGATESSFLAIRALLDGLSPSKNHIITSTIEHASIIDVFRKLEEEGYSVSWLKVNEQGEVSLEDLKSIITKETALVSIQHVNSEIGTIQPIKEIGAFLKEKEILFHSDMVQSYGKLPLDVKALPIDALSISAHKIYGPKGIGAVWINPEVEWKPYFYDPDDRPKLKKGTDNVPAMAAFAAAAKETISEAEKEFERVSKFKKQFTQALKGLDYEFVEEGDPGKSSPYILGARFPGIEGQFLMLECDQAGIAISTGSACQVGSEKPNRTMKGIGRTDEEARQFVRFSFGKNVKEEQLGEIIGKIDTILSRHFSKVRKKTASEA
ncbi:MAG: aminotransferase class V-fold PLP-dependent enzyme [Balneola sp.]|nr:MAG: aminotransferase class V-fold PLP-dependent enzyme [Balneola sp.]